jgi:hypothetical protein
MELNGTRVDRYRPPPPPHHRQKTFIVDNAGILDAQTKKTIVQHVAKRLGGKDCVVRASDGTVMRTAPVIFESSGAKGVSINLDNIEDPAVILHIYNLVYNRRASLSEPAGDSDKTPPTECTQRQGLWF